MGLDMIATYYHIKTLVLVVQCLIKNYVVKNVNVLCCHSERILKDG